MSTITGVIIIILLVLLACAIAALFIVYTKSRSYAKERQSKFTNYDRLSGLGNKGKLLADCAALDKLDSCVIITVHFSRYMELYNLFGVSISDRLIKDICHSFETFAACHGGKAYRIIFNQVVMVLHISEDRHEFSEALHIFIQKLQKLKISLADATYSYDCLFRYGLYYLSEANDSGVEFSDILTHLDHAVMRNTTFSFESYIAMDETNKPDWALTKALSAEARRAWDNHEFVPYYQPIVNINTGKVVGSELLARWQHPTRGLLQPNQFIHILEQNSLIVDLDLYMIEEACKKIQFWLDNGILTVPLAINLSALNIHRADFMDRLVSIVDKYDIPPVLIELELPERNLIFEDSDAFLDTMNYLHKKGFSLSMGRFAEIDNSAIWLLRKLPFDIVKVDYRFFMNPTASLRCDIYVRNFLDLAEKLKIKIVVTHLETAECVKLVQNLGCTNGKGFYFSKPMSSDEFQEFIS